MRATALRLLWFMGKPWNDRWQRGWERLQQAEHSREQGRKGTFAVFVLQEFISADEMCRNGPLTRWKLLYGRPKRTAYSVILHMGLFNSQGGRAAWLVLPPDVAVACQGSFSVFLAGVGMDRHAAGVGCVTAENSQGIGAAGVLPQFESLQGFEKGLLVAQFPHGL